MAGQEVKADIKPDIMRQCTDTSGNVLSEYLSPSKEQEGVVADNEVTGRKLLLCQIRAL